MKILREKIFGNYGLSREIERQYKIRDIREKRKSSAEFEALGNVHDSINSRAMLGPKQVNDRLSTTLSLGKSAKRREAEEMDRQSRSIGKGKIDIPTDKELTKSGYKKVRKEAIDQVDRGDYFRKVAKEREQEGSQAKLNEFQAQKAKRRNSLMKKQEKQAEELRKNNKLGIAVRDAKRNAKKWIKENPGKSAAIGATVAAAGAGLGYAAYKYNKNKKKKAAIVESYTPIEQRIDKNGDDIEPKKKYNGPSLEERVKEREDHEKRLKELKKEFIKSLKKKGK